MSGLLIRVMMGLPDRPETSDGETLAASVVAPAMFTALVDAYSDAIYRYLVRRVGLSEAEDLAAETFLRAFRARGSFRPIYPTALPWLYGIATNLVRDHARAEQRRLAVLSMAVESPKVDGDEARIDEALEAAALLPRVAQAIRDLPADARDVLVLVAVEGLTYLEVAEALCVPVGTVRSRLSRARVQLRSCFTASPPLTSQAVSADDIEPTEDVLDGR